jgi:hypothetical protein
MAFCALELGAIATLAFDFASGDAMSEKVTSVLLFHCKSHVYGILCPRSGAHRGAGFDFASGDAVSLCQR